MNEFRLVLLVLLGIGGLVLLRALDPRVVLLVILGALALINLAMTAISSVQARKADPRFLSGTWLGLLQIFIGLALAAGFHWMANGFDALPVAVAGSFVVGGLVVLTLRTAHLMRSPSQPTGSDSNHPR